MARTRSKKLSDRQKRILKFIADFIEEHHYPPTVRDIQYGCEVSSTSVVDYNLRILQREGHLKRTAEVSRSIELIGDSAPKREALIAVPILSSIAAGEPLHVPPSSSWNEEALDTVEVPAFMTGGKTEVFGLRVKGESMIDALVADGDLVIMEPADNVNNGDMVAAFPEGQGRGHAEALPDVERNRHAPSGQLDHAADPGASRERLRPRPGRRRNQDRLSEEPSIVTVQNLEGTGLVTPSPLTGPRRERAGVRVKTRFRRLYTAGGSPLDVEKASHPRQGWTALPFPFPHSAILSCG